MVNISSRIIKKSFVIVFALLFSGTAFGQNLTQDLEKSFKKYSLTKIENTGANAAETSSLTVKTVEKSYVLQLRPRDLRAPQYRAETETASGTKSVDVGTIKTFRGKIAGAETSEVRLTIDGAEIEGYFSNGEKNYFIEPAKRYSESAQDGDLVVYQEEDFINPEGFTCSSQVMEKIERGNKMIASQNSAVSSTGLRVVELATEADFEFVNLMGGAMQANAEILGILNMVEGVYEQELGLSFDVVYQHSWTSPDPFSGANSDALLRSFQSYWNANKTEIKRDVTHLWTAKSNVLAQGYGFLNVVCSNQPYAYSLSGRVEWVPAKYDVTAHEIGHNLGANHAEAAQGCGNTVMNAVLSAITPLTFCSFSRNEINNYVTANSSCLSQRTAGGTRFDFDGDSKSDSVVFRPSNGVWFILKSSNAGFEGFQFGTVGDKPVPADYDGDGKTDAAVFRNGVWYLLKSSTGVFDAVPFGLASDLPAPADYDGDGKTDVAVFRPSSGSWFVTKSSNGAFSATQFGGREDIPMPADFDGDGKADINLWRSSNGIWFRLNSSNGAFFGSQFGTVGDKPVSGDFDGDGKNDLAVFRPSNGYWYILNSGNGTIYGTPFGISTDTPAPADFNGDGKTDLGVFRNGVWHRFAISQSAYSAVQFGASGDIPAQAFYIQ